MTLLVTGGAGFVGTALLNRLVRESCPVRAAVLAGEGADHLPLSVERTTVQSLSTAVDYGEALRGVDVVVHLAARVHVMNEGAFDSFDEFRKVNVRGTERLAQQAIAAGVRRLVFLSSVKVNGEQRASPYTEDDVPAPEDAYAVSKREAEDVLFRLAAGGALDVVVLRLPLVYGPRVRANFRRLLEAVHRGLPLPLGSIRNRRSLLGVSNLVDAIVVAATHPRAAGNCFLVSDADDVSTPELVRRIAAALRCPARLLPFPVPLMRLAGRVVGKEAAVARLVGSLTVDTSKIRRVLGWSPPFTMQQELADTAEWFLHVQRKCP